jgi:hypothetical protein
LAVLSKEIKQFVAARAKNKLMHHGCSPPWHSTTVVINECAISTFAIRLDDIRPLNPKNIGAIVGVEGGRGTGKPSAPALKCASSFLASKAASQSGQLGSF